MVSELETTVAEVAEILPLPAPVLRALLYQAKWSKMVIWLNVVVILECP